MLASTLSDAGRREYGVTDVQMGSQDGFELVVFALVEAGILDVVAVKIVGLQSEMVHLEHLCSEDERRLLLRVNYAFVSGQVHVVDQRL